MTCDFYIDVFFIINFIVNSILLMSLRCIMKLSARIRDIALGSLCGSLLSCILAAIPQIPAFLKLAAGEMIIVTVMLTAAFHPADIRELIREALGFMLVTVAFGGISMALLHNRKNSLSFIGWLLLMGGAGVLMRYLWMNITEIKQRKKFIYQVTLRYKGKEEKVTAILDTGNHLEEPYSHRPVHILTYDVCKKICGSVTEVVYVPYHSIGRQNGCLPAIVFDSMELEQDGKKRVVDKPLIAVCSHVLSKEGAYEMLINAAES